MNNNLGSKHPRALRDKYLSALGVSALLLLSFAADAQVFPAHSTSYGSQPQSRQATDSAMYGPTGCGTPTDSTFLFSIGFGQGQILKQYAQYYDSCGHKFYLWDPSLKAWHQGDGGGGGSDSGIAVLEGIFVSYVGTTRYLQSDSEYNATRARLQKVVDSLNVVIAAGLATKEPTISPVRLVKYYWNGYKQFAAFNTDSIPEGSTNKYFHPSDTTNLSHRIDTIANKTYHISFRALGQPGDTSYIIAHDSTIQVAAFRDSGALVIVANPDGSRTFYAPSGGGGTTNLDTTRTTTAVTITNSNGTAAVIPVANAGAAGVIDTTMYEKMSRSLVFQNQPGAGHALSYSTSAAHSDTFHLKTANITGTGIVDNSDTNSINIKVPLGDSTAAARLAAIDSAAALRNAIPGAPFRFSDSICTTIAGVRKCVLDSAGGGGGSPQTLAQTLSLGNTANIPIIDSAHIRSRDSVVSKALKIKGPVMIGDSVFSTPKKRIFVNGASVAQGFNGLPTPAAGGFGGLLAAAYNFIQANIAISSTATYKGNLLPNNDSSLFNRICIDHEVPRYDSTTMAYYIITVGDGDTCSPASLQAAVISIHDTLINKGWPAKRVISAGPIYRIGGTGANALYLQYTIADSLACLTTGATYVDFWQKMKNDYPKSISGIDSLHPSPLGQYDLYQAISEVLLEESLVGNAVVNGNLSVFGADTLHGNVIVGDSAIVAGSTTPVGGFRQNANNQDVPFIAAPFSSAGDHSGFDFVGPTGAGYADSFHVQYVASNGSGVGHFGIMHNSVPLYFHNSITGQEIWGGTIGATGAPTGATGFTNSWLNGGGYFQGPVFAVGQFRSNGGTNFFPRQLMLVNGGALNTTQIGLGVSSTGHLQIFGSDNVSGASLGTMTTADTTTFVPAIQWFANNHVLLGQTAAFQSGYGFESTTNSQFDGVLLVKGGGTVQQQQWTLFRNGNQVSSIGMSVGGMTLDTLEIAHSSALGPIALGSINSTNGTAFTTWFSLSMANGTISHLGKSIFADTGALAARFSYNTNLGASFTLHSLTDRNYVDSALLAKIDSLAATIGGAAPFSDASALVKNSSDATKKLILSAAGISTSTTRTATFPDANITVADKLTGLQQFASTTSSQLAGVISDETGSGAAVFATSPALVSPTMTTQTAKDSTTKGANTLYVDRAVAAGIATLNNVPGYHGNVQIVNDADYTVVAGDEDIIYVATLTAERTVTIPSATGQANRHIRINVYNMGGNSLAVTSPSLMYWAASTGSTTQVTNQSLIVLDLISNGTGWYSSSSVF